MGHTQCGSSIEDDESLVAGWFHLRSPAKKNQYNRDVDSRDQDVREASSGNELPVDCHTIHECCPFVIRRNC